MSVENLPPPVKDTPAGRVYVAHPGYAGGVSSSHRAFWVGGLAPGGGSPWAGRLTQVMTGGSLLANTFNQFWVHALNLQDQGVPIQYFAMLHDDIAPEDGWLDILLEDIRATGADLVAAVSPIKDPLGITSTAIDDPADRFNVERRLSMHEVVRLPEIFDARDCGYEDRMTLANTGCWVCDFTKPWTRHYFAEQGTHLRFTIDDRIRHDPGRPPGQRWLAEVAPEDWNFSRDVQALGGVVKITRRVKLQHYGLMPFSNQFPWGQWEYDQSFAHKFGHKPVRPDLEAPPGFAPPGAVGNDVTPGERQNTVYPDVPGWLSDREGATLRTMAAGQRVLEMGSYCGLSTIWMSLSAKSVDCVDTWDGRGTPLPGPTLEVFDANVRKYGDYKRVTVHRGLNHVVLPRLAREGRTFDVIFIDASHDEASVRNDAALALTVLAPGGSLVFHDYGSVGDIGVTHAVTALEAMLSRSGAVPHGRVLADSLYLLRPGVTFDAAQKADVFRLAAGAAASETPEEVPV